MSHVTILTTPGYEKGPSDWLVLLNRESAYVQRVETPCKTGDDRNDLGEEKL